MQRVTMLSGFTIGVPNNTQQGQQPFTVMMVKTEVIVGNGGAQIGYPTQVQQPVIASDLTPEVLEALNAQMAYLGYAIQPLATVPEGEVGG